MPELQPKVSASGGSFELLALTDRDLSKATLLPAAPAGEKSWIQYEFGQPQTFGGLTFITAGGGVSGSGASSQQLEASDDCRQFRTVAAIPGGARTIAFAAVTARFFRVTILTPQSQRNQAGGFGPVGAQIAEFVLHGAVVNRFQEKAALSAATDIYSMATPVIPESAAVRKAGVIDLTSKMRADGTLDWTPPAGKWVALRISCSLTGRQNSPASPEATGL